MSYTLQQRADLLEKTTWASDFTWKEIENMAKYLHVTKTPAGMYVFNEGAKESYMCIITDGTVNVVKHDDDGREKVLSTITSGKVFGEMALFDGEPRSAAVIAARDTTMLVLTRNNLELLMDEAPRLGTRLLYKLGTQLSQRLRMTSGKLVNYI